jgi:hypothetical protein
VPRQVEAGKAFFVFGLSNMRSPGFFDIRPAIDLRSGFRASATAAHSIRHA